jgi:hypothetical protein
MNAHSSNDEIETHLQQALKEMKRINVVFDEECQEYAASHPYYPSILAPGNTPEEAQETFIRHLRIFIEQRLKSNLAPNVERMTSGRGGVRLGAGRPKKDTTRVSIGSDLASWLRKPENI